MTSQELKDHSRWPGRWLEGFAVALLISLVACGHESIEETETAAAVPVAVETAATETFRATIQTSGLVAPLPGAELVVIAPETARVVEIPKAEGERVSQGDVLVRFDIPNLVADVSARRAGMSQASARLDAARANYTRLSSLLSQGVAAPREVEEAKRAQSEAEADLEQAKGAGEAANALAGRSVVHATFAGVVSKRFHNPGDVVEGTASDPVITVINPGKLQVVAAVPASVLSRVVVGHAVRLRQAGDDEGQEATIIAKAPQIDATTGTASVRIGFKRPTSLAAGTSVQVEIVAEEHANALVIPVAALVNDEGELYVMVAGTDNKAHKFPVATGLSSRSRVEITSGLKAGERVIVRGQDGLPEGAAIAVEGQ